MSAYVSSDDLPFTLLIRDRQVASVRETMADWMAGHRVVSTGETVSAGQYTDLLINFGAIRTLIVTDHDPNDGPVVPFNLPAE